MYSSSSKNSELGILKNEFTRKRRHMPIRKLFYVEEYLYRILNPAL